MGVCEKAHILLMEDNPGLARLFQKRLERQGYLVDLANNGEEGLAMYDAGSHDIIVMDQVMPICTGLEVMQILADRGPLPPIIMVTGTGNEQIAVKAIKMGAGDYLVKDADGGYLDLLPTVIEKVLEQRRLAEKKQRAEVDLRQYAAELEARNEELDAFAHTVAHDLKNPLALIVGFAQTLESDYASLSEEELCHYLSIITRNGQRANRIINNLLLLAGVVRMKVEPEALEMADIVGEVLERLTYEIRESQAEIISPDFWPVALGHRPWIEEVWFNYISNAIKYGGSPPRVELGAKRLPGGRVRFWVRDNGQGLKPEEQKSLFVPFTRLGRLKVEGHGLGLSIVQRIIEKLDGEVRVESTLGEGSVFSFTLPAANSNKD